MSGVNYKNLWLILCCAMIIIMVWIGGVTRLTHSGLSITKWQPITGIVPPINHDSWVKEYNQYKLTPEYKKLNFNITLSEFKKIYLIEYIHRLFARITALIFILPLIYFIFKKQLSKNLIITYFIIFFLGFIQGVIGWYMVKSGLIDNPYVSHYRLALHLIMALLIFALLWWQLLASFEYNRHNSSVYRGKFFYISLPLLISIQILFGALTAGLNAGLIYNTFPLMGDTLIPDNLLYITPFWHNIFDNPTTVQFIHRILGFVILINVIVLLLYNNAQNSYPLYTTFILIVTQITLGVLTLLHSVPLVLASVHQVLAFIVFASSLFTLRYYLY